MVGRKESQKPTARLISDGVYEYAERLKQGTLSKATFPFGGYKPDDPKMLPYLEAVGRGDEPKALQTLTTILTESPFCLWHPYTQSTVLHLFILFSQFMERPKEFRDQVNATLNNFVVGWAFGLTGRVFSVRRSYAKRGRTMSLFPDLDERDGAFLTPEASEQHRLAREFVECVKDLKTRLAEAIRWRDLRNQYREASTAGKPVVVEETAEALQSVFVKYLRDWKRLTYPPPSPDETKAIAKKALSGRLGRNPNDDAAYEFLSGYLLTVGDYDMKLTPSLIKNTMSTLSKRWDPRRSIGIPPNLRSPSKKKRN